jgi:hypothetical protein
MATFILVHGGNVPADIWNREAQRNDYPKGSLLGGKIWDRIALILRKQGHQASAPTLEDENTHRCSDHIKQICNLINKNHLKHIILVGHSYGGIVITKVAESMAEKIDALVYVDAALPEPGQSLFDILTLVGFDPIDILGNSPNIAYKEKIVFDPNKIQHLRKIYILCTKSEFLPIARLNQQKIATDKKGIWKYVELKTGHLPQATLPDEVTKILISAISQQ